MASKSGSKSLAAIYAQALYEAAVNAGVLEQVAGEQKSLQELIQKTPKLERFLVSPTIAFDAKRKLIESTFSSFSRITQNFLLVLVDRKRANLLEAIADAFFTYSNLKAGMASVKVLTAQPITEVQRNRLTGVLEKKLNRKIKLDERLKPELLGGMVLQHEDKLWDRSVLSSLKSMIDKMDEVKLTQVKWMENGK
jgi:F-type H+-transporting ATPase subunit delta